MLEILTQIVTAVSGFFQAAIGIVTGSITG